VERESESGGSLGDLDSYEIEGGETKSEILQNLSEFQFSCVSPFLAGIILFLGSRIGFTVFWNNQKFLYDH
jgi:hypothetical protein